MFARMSGRQLAGWGYGIFWCGLLFETVNTFIAARSAAPVATPMFWIGLAITAGSLIVSVAMMMNIRHRPW